VIERLTEPERFGADSADAFEVVVPSLPGFAFSDPVAGSTIPALWQQLMTECLGYSRYGARRRQSQRR
jgi:hypothetical protein